MNAPMANDSGRSSKHPRDFNSRKRTCVLLLVKTPKIGICYRWMSYKLMPIVVYAFSCPMLAA